jgi:hypothetical protein
MAPEVLHPWASRYQPTRCLAVGEVNQSYKGRGFWLCATTIRKNSSASQEWDTHNKE